MSDVVYIAFMLQIIFAVTNHIAPQIVTKISTYIPMYLYIFYYYDITIAS